MQFPLVGVLAAMAAALGLYGIYWYENLDPAEKEEADALAVAYAQRLYGRGLDQLTSAQFSRVNALVKANYVN